MHVASAGENSSSVMSKAVGALLFVGVCLYLTGCQGVSTGNSSTSTPPTATLSIPSTALNFGNVPVNSSKKMTVSATNSGQASLTISKVAIGGTGYSLGGITTPMTLAAGQSLTLTVTFAPHSAGSSTGTITIASTASDSNLTVSLTGAGTATAGQLSVSPSPLGVGSVAVGTSGLTSASLIASGSSVTVNSASSDNAAFSVTGLSFPVTISAGQSVSFDVKFTPKNTGTIGANLTFSSDAETSSTIESVTGTGSAAPVHSVNLSWSGSSSANVSGYNVYRAVFSSSCGSFSRINGLLNTATAYTDASVTDGTSYCYATTAVNSSNEESPYSNVVSNIQIPAP